MYTPSSFAVADQSELLSFIRKNSFATLITSAEGALHASHLPFMAEQREDGTMTLISHLARANPQWHQLESSEEVLVLFTGPHAYISPRWYEDSRSVPTWNYTAVHVYGRAKFITEDSAVRQVLDALVAKYEGVTPEAWKIDWSNPTTSNLLRAIVGFEIAVTRMEGKYKLSQNRSAFDQVAVAAALAQSQNADDHDVATLMRQVRSTPCK